MSTEAAPPPNAERGARDDGAGDREACFCPQAGLIQLGSSGMLTHEVHCLLYRRLRATAVFLALGMSLGFIKHALWGGLISTSPEYGLELHAAAMIVLVACAIVLFVRDCLRTSSLRILELAIFGVAAGFFARMQLHQSALWLAEAGQLQGQVVAAACVPWMLLIFFYSLFIPNTWQRAALVMTPFALMPAVILLLTSAQAPSMSASDVVGHLLLIVTVMGIPTIAGVYGSHRIGALREQIVENKKLGVYRLTRPLGAGGMGEVYLAEHVHLKRPCAIKLIRPERAGDPRAIARFETEVQATARLSHWNTIEIYDYGLANDGAFYYVMEYLPGMNLQEMVDRHGPLPASRAIHFLVQVCGALREAHDIGLVHRDIKPSNVFAALRGGVRDVAKLLDFGLVKSVKSDIAAMDTALTSEGIVVGSPLYAAPEMTVEGAEPDPRMDIYSLGATAYFLVTGKPLFEHDKPLKLLFAHVHEPVTPPSARRPDLPRDLEAVIMKCLAKSPQDRFDSAESLARALSACDDADRWTAEDADRWWASVQESPVDGAAKTTAALSTATIEVGAPATT